MNSYLRRGLIVLLIAVDMVGIALAFLAALVLRFEFAPPRTYIVHFTAALPLVVMTFLGVFLLLGIYSRKWKFASLDEIWAISKATACATMVLYGGLLLIHGSRRYMPLSVVFSGAAIALLSIALTRASVRMTCEMNARRKNGAGVRVLLVGAGSAGETIARDMLRNPTFGYAPKAFVDDNPLKRNLILQGIPISGGRGNIPRIVNKLGIDEIFITMPSAKGQDIREIVDICNATGAVVKILPAMTRILQGHAELSSVRELHVEDLLGREPVNVDLDLVSRYLSGKVVLVTGASGSIGSELSKEILRFNPERLVLLDNDETALFNLQFDLSSIGEQFEMVIADIRELQRIKAVFKRYRPAIVFHSAAMKHVPMMEHHPCEAIKNNIIGTTNLADAAAEFDCERFLLISTDKAVEPHNTMGATKRLSELVMRKYNAKGTTIVGAVRFGNVLGSRGSVVPIFKAQIAKGGPVTVTHPEATRYFMTINEAAQLVIQAGAYLHHGELFILDMGEPMKILELAKKMIAMTGNGEQIDIEFTGLRPGEKMHEALTYGHEHLSPTIHPKISIIKDNTSIYEELWFGISRLINCAREEREDESQALLMALVQRANHIPQDVMDAQYLVRKALNFTHGGVWEHPERVSSSTPLK